MLALCDIEPYKLTKKNSHALCDTRYGGDRFLPIPSGQPCFVRLIKLFSHPLAESLKVAVWALGIQLRKNVPTTADAKPRRKRLQRQEILVGDMSWCLRHKLLFCWRWSCSGSKPTLLTKNFAACASRLVTPPAGAPGT